MKLLGIAVFDLTPDPVDLRARLVDCPGLLSRRAQQIADSEKRLRERPLSDPRRIVLDIPAQGEDR